MKTLAYTAAALAAFAASPLAAQVMAPDKYVATAGASDLYEIQSSQIVLQTTQDPKLRAFAQEMITDHMKSTAKVKGAAAKSGIVAPPPHLMPPQAEMIAELTSETGPARDAAYIAQQKQAHGQALDVQKAYAEDGTAPALKTAASAIVPVVEHHIAMLKTM